MRKKTLGSSVGNHTGKARVLGMVLFTVAAAVAGNKGEARRITGLNPANNCGGRAEVAVRRPADRNIASHPCHDDGGFRLEQAESLHSIFFQENSAHGRRNIQGVMLVGTDEELRVVESVLGANPPRAWSQAAAACGTDSTPRCVLGKLLKSDEAALLILSIPRRYGIRFSLSQEKNLARDQETLWSVEQLRQANAALERFPKELLRKILPVTVFPVSPASAAIFQQKHKVSVNFAGLYLDREGVILMNMAQIAQQDFQVNLVHELGHAVDFRVGRLTHGEYISGTSGFRALSGWEKPIFGTLQHRKGAKFVRGYSATDPKEEFADLFALYLLQPEVVRKLPTGAFDYLKSNVFSGKEFAEIGVIDSDELERAIERAGGYSRLAETCLEDLALKINARREVWVFNGSGSGGFRSDVFEKKNSCYRYAARSLLDDQVADATLRNLGGEPKVADHLRGRMSAFLHTLWQELTFAVKKLPLASCGELARSAVRKALADSRTRAMFGDRSDTLIETVAGRISSGCAR